jgi:hypothetical protein
VLKHTFAIAWLVFVLTLSMAGQLTSNVFRRTFFIQYGEERGTAFTIDVDEREYLVTASHVVEGIADGGEIQIRKGEKWLPLKITKVLKCDDPIDITVLVPPEQISVNFELEPTMDGAQFGQELYFVGFPYGDSEFYSRAGNEISEGFPLAFQKRGGMSAWSNQNGVITIYMDGFNNLGFSGGPVVFRDPKKTDYVFKVMAVVSGFPAEYSKVYHKREIQPSEVTLQDKKDGRVMYDRGEIYRLDDTSEVVMANTGMVKTFGIKHAVDIIKKNPVGPKVSDKFVDWPKPQ